MRYVLLLLAMASSAWAQATPLVPQVLSYQGTVTNTDGSVIGASSPENRLVAFRIYGSQGATVPLHAEVQTVVISRGEFSAQIGVGDQIAGVPEYLGKNNLGALFTLPNMTSGTRLFLSIAVGGPGTTSQTIATVPEALPRQAIVSSAFAFRSQYSESVLPNGVSTSALQDAAVTSGKIAAGSVNSNHLAASAVGASAIGPSVIDATKLATAAVTDVKIQDGAVTTAKIQNLAVTGAKIADLAITSGKLGDGAVTSSKIGGSAVGTAQVADSAITSAKLAASSVTSTAILDGTVATNDIANKAVTHAKLSDAVVRDINSPAYYIDVTRDITAASLPAGVTLTAGAAVTTDRTFEVNIDALIRDDDGVRFNIVSHRTSSSTWDFLESTLVVPTGATGNGFITFGSDPAIWRGAMTSRTSDKIHTVPAVFGESFTNESAWPGAAGQIAGGTNGGVQIYSLPPGNAARPTTEPLRVWITVRANWRAKIWVYNRW